MKNLVLILLTFIMLTNVGYASFPVADTLMIKQDSLKTEEIKQYHANLIRMGVDLNDCKCESCRKGNKFQGKDTTQRGATGLYILSGLILLGVIIWFSIGLIRTYNCLNNRSDCPQSSGEKPKRGAPVELAWMSLLILISVGVAIKARFIQLRSKKDI